MQVATAQEALFMACEMESSAIQLYTRALSLMEQLGRQDEPLYDHLTLMLADEQEHLAQFRALGGGDALAQERRVALSAAADNILFEGGLLGAGIQLYGGGWARRGPACCAMWRACSALRCWLRKHPPANTASLPPLPPRPARGRRWSASPPRRNAI